MLIIEQFDSWKAEDTTTSIKTALINLERKTRVQVIQDISISHWQTWSYQAFPLFNCLVGCLHFLFKM